MRRDFVCYMVKLGKKESRKNLQMHFTVRRRIFTIVSQKFYGFLSIQFCHERIRIAKSTSVIINVMGIFMVTLSHLL